ncbi:c-type cytochrome [Thiocapsa sp. UBA6158]|jgi:sulfide dehydrogenase cytochrome subunit|uniref:c-type cytochrome n=1 Tax=Thiocapsa sp. UBA6158 TaxID=1947692 RepID=UPI0025D7C422|nr:hypothetical protein [Thiocapsa sp. UBA6158]
MRTIVKHLSMALGLCLVMPAGIVCAVDEVLPTEPTGADMAHTCAACHGTNGELGDEYFMSLAGMPVEQFVTSMLEFRSGARAATLMGFVASGFSDAEIQSMAEFFVTAPELQPMPPTEPTGADMAHTCAACHGTNGELGDEYFMPLAGMPAEQFVTSMLEFRSGARAATLMGFVASGFSDAEIAAMGEFFAALEPPAQPELALGVTQ